MSVGVFYIKTRFRTSTQSSHPFDGLEMLQNPTVEYNFQVIFEGFTFHLYYTKSITFVAVATMWSSREWLPEV